MNAQPARAKINLALVVGATRADGKHEVTTVMQAVELCDRIALEPAARLTVAGFADDTIVRAALQALAAAAGVEPTWAVTITKGVPVAAGLGGGSSDAATALRLANASLERPLTADRLHELAANLGADVPFFLTPGPKLGEGDGSTLTVLGLPQDYTVLLALPNGETKPSTRSVYGAFDRRDGAAGYGERRSVLLRALGAGDLRALPPNDLASSPLSAELLALGAFRADVSGAGPTVYGLFAHAPAAEAAAAALAARARTWITAPAWYV